MKQPNKLEYPNTRLNRAYGKRRLNDLVTIGREHYKNADDIRQKMNSKPADEDWLIVTSGYGGKDMYYNEKTGHLYNPYTGNMKVVFDKSSENPRKPKVDMDGLSQIEEQKRLAELAFASDRFGRDLYHDADYRSGKKDFHNDEKDFSERPGYRFSIYSNEELEDVLKAMGNYGELPYRAQMAYMEIKNELRRRKESKNK